MGEADVDRRVGDRSTMGAPPYGRRGVGQPAPAGGSSRSWSPAGLRAGTAARCGAARLTAGGTAASPRCVVTGAIRGTATRSACKAGSTTAMCCIESGVAGSAPGCRHENAARLTHADRREGSDGPPKRIPGQGVHVVEVDHARRRDAVAARRQLQLRDQSAYGSGQRSHDHRADSVRDRIAGEDENRPITTGRHRKPDLTALHEPSRPSLRQDPTPRSPSTIAPRS